MNDFKYDDAITLRDAAKAIREGAEWTPKMTEAVASLLDVAAEDIASAEIRGASWARWEWTHYCFAVAAQALSEPSTTFTERATRPRWSTRPMGRSMHRTHTHPRTDHD